MPGFGLACDGWSPLVGRRLCAGGDGAALRVWQVLNELAPQYDATAASLAHAWGMRCAIRRGRGPLRALAEWKHCKRQWQHCG